MSRELILGLVVSGAMLVLVGGALVVFRLRRTAGRPLAGGHRGELELASNTSPTFLPNTPLGLGAGRFVTPIGVDSTPFDETVLAVAQSASEAGYSLTIRIALQNRNSFSCLVAIPITHSVYLNCELEREFERDTSPRLTSRSVLDVQRRQSMFGPGKDQQVLFGPNESKEFVIQFDKTSTSFHSFDLEFFLEAAACPYGRYRLRYDFQSGRFTRRFLLAQPPRPW